MTMMMLMACRQIHVVTINDEDEDEMEDNMRVRRMMMANSHLLLASQLLILAVSNTGLSFLVASLISMFLVTVLTILMIIRIVE